MRSCRFIARPLSALAWSLDELPQRGQCLGETGALAAGDDERRQDGPDSNRIGDEARVSGVRRVDLPVAGVLPEEPMSTPCGQLPFHPSPARIRILVHVEAERDRTAPAAVD